MIKQVIAVGIVSLVPAVTSAQTYVQGYHRDDGTYVQPHYRSNPNDTKLDNYNARGNTNPYTGRQGTVGGNTYETYPSYNSGRSSNTGCGNQTNHNGLVIRPSC